MQPACRRILGKARYVIVSRESAHALDACGDTGGSASALEIAHKEDAIGLTATQAF